MTKNIIYIILLLVSVTNSGSAQNYKLGTSLALMKDPSAYNLEEVKKQGFEYVEITINNCFRKLPKEQVTPCIEDLKRRVDSAGLKVWSVHLPFSKVMDISVLDEKARSENIEYMAEMIEFSAIFKPFKLILHPSSEPISNGEREQRILNSINSIDYLRTYANKIGAQLCIENLPRTCLGNKPDEMYRLIEQFDDVGFCFDTNHYLQGDPNEYFEKLSKKIGTIHVSDYDGIDERHWTPGLGNINWGAFMQRLQTANYQGVFMFEVVRNKEKGAVSPFELLNGYKYIVSEYEKLK